MNKYKRFRMAVQGAAALLQNANFKGFFTGKIYEGNLKSVCVPGLNCYSCPGRRAPALSVRCKTLFPPTNSDFLTTYWGF